MPDRDAMIAKVQALWAQADHPNTTAIEASVFRDKAAEIMARYQIDDLMLESVGGVSDDIMFAMIRLDGNRRRLLVPDERQLLMLYISRNFDCKGVIKNIADTADVDTGKPIEGGTFFQVIGFRSDVDLSRSLYFTLVVDLMTNLMSEQQKLSVNYSRNFAIGYADRIAERLREVFSKVTDIASQNQSVALALRDKKDRVKDKFDEMYPPGNLRSVKIKGLTHDAAAAIRGKRAADNADLGNGQTRVGSSSQKALS